MSALWRYPVKAMAGEALDQVEVSWHGLAGDRRWAFVRDGQVRSGFPWLTIRERSAMALYEPFFVEPDRPDESPTRVSTPWGDELDVADPLLAEELGTGVGLIKQNRGVFDSKPLSLITTQTVAALGDQAGTDLDVRRFRPNLVIDVADDAPYREEEWVGSLLRIGTMRMRVDRRDPRCVVVNVDPATADRDATVLRTIAREREGCLGVYGSTVEPGGVKVGDPVILLSAPTL